MNIKSVCAPNCPDRTAECKLTCEKFLLYDRERLENAAKAQKEYNTKNYFCLCARARKFTEFIFFY